MGGLVVDVQDAAFAAKGWSSGEWGTAAPVTGLAPPGNRNRMPEAGGHQGEQPSLDPGDSRSARKSARPLLDRAASTVIALCKNPAHGLTCCFTLGGRVYSSRRLGYGPDVRLAGVFGRSDVDKDGHWSHQGLQQEPPRQSGRAVDITARIERRQVPGGLISEYRKAAERARSATSAVMNKFWPGTNPRLESPESGDGR